MINSIKMLITGASGFVGGHIYHQARQRWRTCAIYRQNSPNEMSDEWRQVDLTDSAEMNHILDDFAPDLIIHAAAVSNLDVCEKAPDLANAVNVETTARLAAYTRQNGKRLIFISSDMVFDGSRGMYKETDETSPISVYGRSKLMAERAVMFEKGNWVVVRTALVYGKPKTGGSSFSEWLEGKLRRGELVHLYYDQFRTLVWVNNLAEAILEIATGDFTGVIHLAGANRIDRFSFGKQYCLFGGFDGGLLVAKSVHEDAHVAPRPVDVSLSIGKAQSILKTRLLSTEEGLRRLFSSASRSNIAL
jgi:dTDP-4-dehydrorhamnose reductase